MNILRKIQRTMIDESGATSVEYALMVAFIAIVAIGAVIAFGHSVTGLFQTVPAF